MHKFPGALCIGKDGQKYLAIYNFQHDIYAKPSNMTGLEYIEHSSYSKGGKKGGIDYYLFTGKREVKELIQLNKTILNQDKVIIKTKEEEIEISKENLEESDFQYDIITEQIPLNTEIIEDLNAFRRADIKNHCKENFAKKRRSASLKIVNQIIPKTEIKYINRSKYLDGGKNWFIKECLASANLDINRGCVTGFIPEENAFFDGKMFHNFFAIPSNECTYCYGEWSHQSFPKNMYKNDFNALEKELLGNCTLNFNSKEKLGKKVEILRLGKRTEIWTPFNQDDVLKILETCAKVGTKCIIPTKLMPFNNDIAELLKKTKSTLLHSTNGNSKITELEKGAIAYGSTPEWRTEQSLKYKEQGVNSSIYLMIVAHQAPTQKEIEILEQTDYGRILPIQLLPLRIKRELANTFLEKNTIIYTAEKNQKSIDIKNNSESPIYIKDGKFSRTFIPKTIHPFWLNLIKNNNRRIRICHHDDELIYCGGCFQKHGCISNKY